MSKERSGTESLAREFFRNQKKVLDLIRARSDVSGFQPAVHRLFGDKPDRRKTIKVGSRLLFFSSLAANRVSFLPARWQEELDKIQAGWPGCENWWAGYPLITWIETRASDNGTTELKLNAEVGPVSDYKLRNDIIGSIRSAAAAQGLERIRFPAGSTDQGRLYSRFFVKNSVTLNDVRKTDQVERKIVHILNEFGSEFDLVASVLRQFLTMNVTAPR